LLNVQGADIVCNTDVPSFLKVGVRVVDGGKGGSRGGGQGWEVRERELFVCACMHTFASLCYVLVRPSFRVVFTCVHACGPASVCASVYVVRARLHES